MAALIDCKPKIINEKNLNLTLRFRSMEEKNAFKEAVREAHLTPDEFRNEYAGKHGIAQGTPAATD